MAEVTSSGSLDSPDGFVACRLAGTSCAAAEVAMELDKVSQAIEETRGLLKSCEDAQERRELRRLMTTLLEKEARLAGTAAGELGGVQQGCRR